MGRQTAQPFASPSDERLVVRANNVISRLAPGAELRLRILSHVFIPVTNDSEWQSRFAELPDLAPPTDHLVVVVPHPDDETLGAGGLIESLATAGVPLTIVAVTDGENAYDIPLADRQALAQRRIEEQVEALSLLGVQSRQVQRLHLEDSGLAACGEALAAHLLAVAKPNTTLLAPWIGDFHPDHVACARAAGYVAASMNLPLLSYFFWTWHRATPDALDGLPLKRFNLSPHTQAVKKAALAMHRSQLDWPDGSPILPDSLLGPSRWPFEVFVQS